MNGVQQAPIEGTSMVYTFDEPDAPERHDLQYFEMAGNRGIYFKGWSAVTRHSTPWLPNEVLPPLDDDVWELYDGATDWTQATGPRRRAAGAAREAATAVVDRGGEVQRAADRRPPVRAAQRDHRRPPAADHRAPRQVLFPGMKRLSEDSVIDIKNRSFTVTAAIETPATGSDERGDHRAGRPVRRLGALRQTTGRAKFVYNVLGMQEFVTEATEDLPSGTHQVRAEFAYDGGGLAKGGDVTLYYDGAASAAAGST